MAVRRREVEKRKKIELSIEAKDFGPISDGKITLKPLTLFIGPNSSGKSYAAMLVHSIFGSYTPSALPMGVLGVPLFFRIDMPKAQQILAEELSSLRVQIAELKGGEELEISKPISEKVTNKIFDELYKKGLSEKIVHSYACPLNELIRIGERSFDLKINVDSYEIHLTYQYSRKKLKITDYPKPDIKIKVKVSRRVNYITVRKKEEKEYLVQISKDLTESDKKFAFSLLTDTIFEIYINNLLENIAVPCYYLPAARSGILQGHKALAASIVKKAPYVGIEPLKIPKFSGVVADFISSILTLPLEEKGTFYPLAQEFEKELIKGEIVVHTLAEHVPEIQYNFLDTEIPLHRASSTVSELAPLFLYLKYVIKPGNVLIIEEPEAHLHPGNQRILARFLVKLIRNGVYIIITTHSEYLLEQLSSFIMLSKIEPKKRVEKYGYDEEDFLEADEIAAYLFKIIETLYEETIRLRRDLSGDT
jgi:predicted ATPase